MSNQEAMSQLAERFMNDTDFREQMRQDPEGTAQRSGLQLDEEDPQALRSMDWSSSDEQFREQMRQDPEGAAERSGYHLDDEDKQALRSVDWSGSNEALNDRVSKLFRPWC